MTSEALRDALRERLRSPLPGREAHRICWPEDRALLPLDAFPDDYRAAAVLIAILPIDLAERAAAAAGTARVPEGARFVVPMIRRPEAMEHHAGQIAFPGGERHPGEPAVAAALREAEEEVGLSADAVEVLGSLTPIPIDVSRFRVEPVVAWCRHVPEWRLDAREVEALHFADLDQWAAAGPKLRVERVRGGLELRVPAYDLDGHAVWGASAFMLAELLWLWREWIG